MVFASLDRFFGVFCLLRCFAFDFVGAPVGVLHGVIGANNGRCSFGAVSLGRVSSLRSLVCLFSSLSVVGTHMMVTLTGFLP